LQPAIAESIPSSDHSSGSSFGSLSQNATDLVRTPISHCSSSSLGSGLPQIC
jgi:hypothetical protein